MRLLILALLLIGCEAPKFEFETEGLPCSIPAKISHVKGENTKGCWRLTSKPGHGIVLDDPGPMSCDDGAQCVIVVQGQDFWTVGSGNNVWVAEDVDCSEPCP